MRLVQRTAIWLQEGRVTELAALRSADFLEPLLRRESYLALLWERPMVHERLLKLLGSARWPATYLLQHPGVMDELAGDAWLTERFNPAEFESELAMRLKALRPLAKTTPKHCSTCCAAPTMPNCFVLWRAILKAA